MSLTSKLTLSREEIRNRLVNELSNRLDINSEKLSAEEGTFTAYMLDAISAIGADILFYASSVYRESTLVTALLPETVRNWARYIDYQPKTAVPAQVVALMKIPLQGYFNIVISKNHNFYASGIPFRPMYEYQIDYSPDKLLVTYTNDNITSFVPFTVEYNSNIKSDVLKFPIALWQTQETEEQFRVEDAKPLEFFKKQYILPEEQQIVSIRVFVTEDSEGTEVEWPQKNILLLGNDEKGYEAQIIRNEFTLMFGNGMYGHQLKKCDVRVVITTTLGKKGNIISGTLNTGEALYTIVDADNPMETYIDPNNVPPNVNVTYMPVNYEIINTEEATGGKDSEGKDETKRNAPLSLSMLHRIVSEADYKNTPLIITGDTQGVSKPVLKRSDLAVNDIDLYLVIRYKDEVVPTNTIPVVDDGHTDYYKAFHVFNYDGKDWYCPFELNVIREYSYVTYTYIKPTFTLDITRQFLAANYHHVLARCKGVYDYDSQTHTLYVYIIRGDINNNINYTQDITLQKTDSVHTISPDETNVLSNNRIVEFIYRNLNDLKNVRKLYINTYEEEVGSGNPRVLTSTYSAEPYISADITDISRSPVREIDGTKYLLDIPVVLKEWVDNLVVGNDTSQRDDFLKQVIEDFTIKVNDYQTRMMNTSILAKFAKTHGTIENYKKSETDFWVQLVANDSASVPQIPTKYYAISDPIDENDPLFDSAGHLVVWTGVEFETVRVPVSTTISVGNDNEYRITDGRRWIIPVFKMPLEVHLQLHFSRVDRDLVDKIKEDVCNYINSVGIEGCVYLSKITDIIHNYTDVKYVRILKPKVDLVYKNIMKNMNKIDLVFYTPEYIWTNKENIKIQTFTE